MRCEITGHGSQGVTGHRTGHDVPYTFNTRARERAREGAGTGYSKGLSHRNRLGGGSQSISKFSWEIEPTVSQFLNVHGKFSESRVSIGLLLVCLCAVRSIN